MDNENQAKPAIDPAATFSLVFGLLAIVFVILGSLPLQVVQFNTVPLGLCSVFFAISAIFFGQQALKRISVAKQTLAGRWRAISGLGIGYLWLGIVVFSIVSALVRSTMDGFRVAKINGCQDNIQTIWMGCQNYAGANHNQLPPDLDTLLKTGLLEPRCLICPTQKSTSAVPPSYLYFGAGLKLEDLDDKTILVAEKNRFHTPDLFLIGFGKGHIGNGHVEYLREPGDLATIARKHGWKLPGAEKNGTNATSETNETNATPQERQ